MSANPVSWNASVDPDRALLARLRAGEEAAFVELVRTCGGRMLATARRLLHDEQDARDAVQEALLSAFRGLSRFAGEARLSTWLHRIVVNAALMKLRTRRRRPEASLDELLPRFDEHGEWAERSEATALEGDRWLERQEARNRVRRCIPLLPESLRTVLVLRDLEEMDAETAAELLGISGGALKTRTHRARQALRTLLAREAGEAGAGKG